MPSSTTGPRGGRAVAWIGFVFGSIISTAGNVLYTWIPPQGKPETWAPTLTAQLFAAVWPIALLLSVEVLSRVQWAPGLPWTVARYGGAGTVALGSGVISYGHLSGVLASWQYGTVGAHVGPLVLDGLMVVSGFALLCPADRASVGAAPATTRPSAPRIQAMEPGGALEPERLPVAAVATTAPAAAPPQPSAPYVHDPRDLEQDTPEWWVRYDAIPPCTVQGHLPDGSNTVKGAKARVWLQHEWEAGRDPQGSVVDKVVGGPSQGRQARRLLKQAGILPPPKPPVLVAAS